jgi:hypothetical protein
MRTKIGDIVISGVFSVGAILFSGVAGRAEILNVEVLGVVNVVHTEGGFAFDDSVYIGSQITGYFTYDSEAEDRVLSENLGSYVVESQWMRIGNYRFYYDELASDPAEFNVYVTDPGYDVYTWDACFAGLIYVDGEPRTFDEVLWQNTELVILDLLSSKGDLVTNDSLPVSFPAVSEFDLRNAVYAAFQGPNDEYFSIGGPITSIRVIPEPGTVVLFGIGVLTAVARKKR